MSLRASKIFDGYGLIFSYIFWAIIDLSVQERTIGSTTILIVSWIGLIVSIIYLIRWKKITNSFFSLMHIFLLFFIVFNFGQCLLWAFNIHTEGEIGKKLVFSSLQANNSLILRSQLLFIVSYISFNTGAIFFWDLDKSAKIVPLKFRNLNSDKRYRILYLSSVILATISIPSAITLSVMRFVYSQIFSYHDLYYGDISNTSILANKYLRILSEMFVPCLFGLLIGSGYKKNVKIFSYLIFFLFSLITLLAGDRGEWIIPLIMMIWTDDNFNKKMNVKKYSNLIVISFVCLYFVKAIVSLRNIGLSLDRFIHEIISPKDNFIIEMITEFGHTMGICILLFNEKISPFYGNTFLWSFPTIFGTGIANKIFQINYVQLHTWFPSEYLNINYGTDFSMIGEAMLNYGAYATPVVLFIEGAAVSRLFISLYIKDISPLNIVIIISCIIPLIKTVRSTFWLLANQFAIISCIYTVVYLISYFLVKNKLF